VPPASASGWPGPAWSGSRAPVNAKLFPMYGPTTPLELDHDDPEPPDRESDDRERTSKATALKTLIEAGVDPDNPAAVCGMPAVWMREPAGAP
jgi:hypothetical protein